MTEEQMKAMRIAARSIANVADPAAVMPDLGVFYSSPGGIHDPMQTMGMTYTRSNKAPASSYDAATVTK